MVQALKVRSYCAQSAVVFDSTHRWRGLKLEVATGVSEKPLANRFTHQRPSQKLCVRERERVERKQTSLTWYYHRSFQHIGEKTEREKHDIRNMSFFYIILVKDNLDRELWGITGLCTCWKYVLAPGWGPQPQIFMSVSLMRACWFIHHFSLKRIIICLSGFAHGLYNDGVHISAFVSVCVCARVCGPKTCSYTRTWPPFKTPDLTLTNTPETSVSLTSWRAHWW